MDIRFLGTSAAIGGGNHTICLRLGEDTLIDAGTAISSLAVADLAAIRHVFLTHSHLDHCGLLPLLADARLAYTAHPLHVHALPETIAALKEHVFNGILWPDYTLGDQACVRLCPVATGIPIQHRELTIEALPTRHAIPAAGWLVRGKSSFAYSADTGYCPEFWTRLAMEDHLKAVAVECTMPNHDIAAAQRGGHMTPADVIRGDQLLPHPHKLLILHTEPALRDEIMAAVKSGVPSAELALQGSTLSL